MIAIKFVEPHQLYPCQNLKTIIQIFYVRKNEGKGAGDGDGDGEVFKISYTERNIDIYSKTFIHIYVYQYNGWLLISQKIRLCLRGELSLFTLLIKKMADEWPAVGYSFPRGMIDEQTL